jgi:hypothetical protein
VCIGSCLDMGVGGLKVECNPCGGRRFVMDIGFGLGGKECS